MRHRAVALIVAGLLLLLLSLPFSEACFRSLRRPSYETYWLGTYYDSRILSVTCFALRSFRWALKFIKVTYEGWHVEMDYVRCLSDSYDMSIPFFTPPWGKFARMYKHGTARNHEQDHKLMEALRYRHYFSEMPLMTRNDPSEMLSLRSDTETSFDVQKWSDKADFNKIIGSLEPLVLTSNKLPDTSLLSPNESGNESIQEALRIFKSLFQIFVSLLKELEILFSRTLGAGVLTCTRKYLRRAFWRWVDKAPFLR